ncbi:cytochrome c oxidase assembly protein [Rufibacter psychrotolerans]|uniref:cytochrome c oxidase assembly protein n=1 Tax=Rufibacter psychrotolerans TaxID=2812556 RepID=UPI0019683096|nr:cytochrome c oxidase assembly protein [Rufibacter sp. SYSU D00308]
MHQHEPTHALAGGATGLIPLLLIALVLALYLAAVAVMRQKHRPWSGWRSLSFGGGLVLLFVALLPPLMQLAHHDIRGHMVQHLLVGMLAPLGLVLGAPVTLALNTLPRSLAKLLTRLLGSSFFHVISHPVTALLLNIGGMYALYLTPLYNATLTSPALHHLLHLHFLAAGYLFTWSIAGPDPAPRRPGFRVRALVLFVSIAAHAYLSKVMYAFLYPQHSPHGADQIRAAAKLMYYGGDFSELLLAVAFFAAWYRKRRHPKHQNEVLFT